MIEYLIRRRTMAVSNVHFERAAEVRTLVYRDGRVRGVRCGDSRSFEAELVVDATGRTSRAPQWLSAIGFPRPQETVIGVDTAYSTANFRHA
jgi:flavin-dependent dehydrogenase